MVAPPLCSTSSLFWACWARLLRHAKAVSLLFPTSKRCFFVAASRWPHAFSLRQRPLQYLLSSAWRAGSSYSLSVSSRRLSPTACPHGGSSWHCLWASFLLPRAYFG